MPSGRPLNYSTKIPVHQTVTECQSILAAAGAASVAVHFENGDPAGLSFTLKTPHGMRSFTLPVNLDGMHAVLQKEAGPGGSIAALHRSRAEVARLTSRKHAAEMAWRVVKDWLEANLALVAAQMATLTEVMLPYLHVDEDRTLWRAYQEREQAAIEAGGRQP